MPVVAGETTAPAAPLERGRLGGLGRGPLSSHPRLRPRPRTAHRGRFAEGIKNPRRARRRPSRRHRLLRRRIPRPGTLRRRHREGRRRPGHPLRSASDDRELSGALLEHAFEFHRRRHRGALPIARDLPRRRGLPHRTRIASRRRQLSSPSSRIWERTPGGAGHPRIKELLPPRDDEPLGAHPPRGRGDEPRQRHHRLPPMVEGDGEAMERALRPTPPLSKLRPVLLRRDRPRLRRRTSRPTLQRRPRPRLRRLRPRRHHQATQLPRLRPLRRQTPLLRL
mmetsp:Transcript_11480/g.37723  ORF Transcript_11480/g.37723 Transcript_11480/m.37723 type:complete len:280 (+) Transcript_11480:409-1248(+)